MRPKVIRRAPALAALALPLLTAAALSAQSGLPPADQIIDRYVEAIGGREAVLSHTSSRSTGTISMPAAGIEGTLEVLSTSDPIRLMTRVEIPGMGTILSGYIDGVGWSVNPTLGPRLLEGTELDQLKESASDDASLRDASLFDVRETVEQTEMNGESCYKVRLVWKSGRETFDCYSTDSGLRVATQSTQETPMGEIEAVTLLSDYQDFGGVLTPTKMTQQMMGQEQIMTVDSIDFAPIDPAEFQPPKEIQTLMGQQGGSQP